MMIFAKEIIVEIVNSSKRHNRLKEIFTGAIGALDGTRVHAAYLLINILVTEKENL